MFRGSDDVHLRQKAKASGSASVFQSGGKQVVFEAGAHVYLGAQQPPPFPPVSVRPPVNLQPRRLHGRDTELKQLGDGDIRSLVGAVTVLHGMGGIGKSALALSTAATALADGMHVFWIEASQSDGVRAAHQQIAVRLGGSEKHAREMAAGHLSVTDLAWEALHASGETWLLVFDGADEPHMIERDLGPGWLEPSASGAVLVTTRQGSPEFWPPGADLVKVNALEPVDGMRMLLGLAGSVEPSTVEREAARALAERLGGIPLALHAAGRCVSQPLSPLRDFAAFHEALERDFENVVDRAVGASTRPRPDDDSRHLVMRTWEVSLDALEQQGISRARSLMRVLSCWAAQPVPVALLLPKILSRAYGNGGVRWDDLVVERALTALNAAGLINVVAANPVAHPVAGNAFYRWGHGLRAQQCVIVHPLVAEVTGLQLERSPERVHAWSAAIRCLGTLRGTWGTPESFGHWQLAIPHARSMAARLPRSIGELFDVIAHTQEYLSRYLRESGQYETAYQAAMALHDRLGDFHSGDATRFRVTYACAEWSWRRSRLEEADAFAAEACRLADATMGPATFDAFAARELALAIHTERGFLKSGEKMARQLCEELTGRPEFLQLFMQTRHHLATILRESGRLDEAEKHSRHAVGIADETDSPPFTSAITRHELGVILWHRGHLHAARELLAEVLRLQRSILPPWHPAVLVTRYDIASIHAVQGNAMRALFDFLDISLVERDILGAEHHSTLQSQHQIGQVMTEMGELDQAESVLREVEKAHHAQNLQGRSMYVLSTRHELAHITAQRGHHAQAHREWREIFEEERKQVGEDHPSTLRTQFNLAICCAVLRLPGVARAEMRRVLAARRRILGPDHHETRQAAQALTDLIRLPPEAWRFGSNRRNLPTSRKERRGTGAESSRTTSGPG
ncbi:tetratricopeptide repeat protein [Streptomyces sp. NPDC057638]|uniref:tetratricopeptide repeat protein n=1 Tax=Streptomyces sp. NPDC057638 TaxID=3346190 RepID=UPI0036BD82DE